MGLPGKCGPRSCPAPLGGPSHGRRARSAAGTAGRAAHHPCAQCTLLGHGPADITCGWKSCEAGLANQHAGGRRSLHSSNAPCWAAPLPTLSSGCGATMPRRHGCPQCGTRVRPPAICCTCRAALLRAHRQTRSMPSRLYRASHSSGGHRRALYIWSSHRAQSTCCSQLREPMSFSLC